MRDSNQSHANFLLLPLTFYFLPYLITLYLIEPCSINSDFRKRIWDINEHRSNGFLTIDVDDEGGEGCGECGDGGEDEENARGSGDIGKFANSPDTDYCREAKNRTAVFNDIGKCT